VESLKRLIFRNGGSIFLVDENVVSKSSLIGKGNDESALVNRKGYPLGGIVPTL